MNRVVLITGGGKGLGRHIAVGYAQAGDNVVLLGRNENALLKTAEEIKKIGSDALLFPTDISNESQVNSAVEKTISQFGKIDIAVLNAGIYLEKPFIDMTSDEWKKVIDINLTGNFYVTKALVPEMKKNNGGRIICISSVGGHTGLARKSAYCASKFGLTGFFKSLAKELKQYKIAVNILYPYYIDSHLELDWEKHSDEILNSWHPNDVVKLILFLSDQPLRASIEDIYLDPFQKK